ncbi:hypothetical protein GB937_010741 [Aspergillus fischeri]|nr:hypothetical protein GB937_010741 [Aspergillus fischeri]
MHLLILGATGKSGGYGYKYALSQGHHVTVIVRNATGLGSHPKLTVVEGSVLSQVDMDNAFSAAGIHVDAVLKFLNPHRSSRSPWAKFLGPPRLLADATANAARALRRQQQQEHGRKPRLVVMSALGAGESRKVTPFITRFIIDHSNVGKTYEDHNAVDAEIEGNCEGEVAWTVALAVGLGDAGVKPVKTFEHTQRGASWLITRESCARWMVDVAAGTMEDEFSNKRVIVSN